MNTFKQLAFAALAGTVFVSGFAQSDIDYSIDVTVEGLSNDTVYLAQYYGNKLYYADTTVTDAKGRLYFPGQPFEKCGKHAIVIPGPK